MKVLLNGQLFEEHAAKIACDDRGLLFGDGIFETVRLYQGVPRFLSRHWQRLVGSAEILELHLPVTYDELNCAIALLVDACQWQQHDAGVRVTITRGRGLRNLLAVNLHDPQFIIELFPLPEDKHMELVLHISSIRRNQTSPLSMIKSLNYLDNILAQQQAQRHGANFALFLNTQGMVASANMANVFLIKNHHIITPPLQDGVLPGITRQRIIDACNTHQLSISEQSFTLDMIESHDSLWLSNSLRGIMPVTKVGPLILRDDKTLRLKVAELIA